jgi:dephospho-CoA kinase
MSTYNNLQLIGLSGTFGSGKDTLARQLAKDFGYTHVSTGDILREFTMKEHGSIERPLLYATGEKLRKEIGADALVVKALEKPRPLVITGMRSLGEAKAIKAAGGKLVFLDAPLNLRYERMRSRKRDHEVGLSLEEFQAREADEWYMGDDDADFNLKGVKALSDFVIDNGLPLREFLESAYEKLGFKNEESGARPDGSDARQA